jgi:hypothetical protein
MKWNLYHYERNGGLFSHEILPEKNTFHYIIFSPNLETPIKVVIRQLPPDTPAEDISSKLQDLGFSVINARETKATGTAPNGQTPVVPLPLILVTLTRNVISQEIFKQNNLNHIIIKVVLYRSQTGLTQGYNFQNIGHVWDNFKEPPPCLWCCGGHLRKECPEKTNTESRRSCCNCNLLEGEKPHPASYRGCSHTKGELQGKRAQRDPKGSSGRTFFSRFTSPELSYADALPQDTKHQQPQELKTQMGKVFCTPCSSICHNRKFREQVCQHRLLVRLKLTP